MPPAIQIKNLTKRFNPGRNEFVAVDNLNLSIPQGQIFGFLGPNGAGKTTTIRMICGLVQPTTGDVFLNGYHVTEDRPEAMRQIGVVLEGARNIYWQLNAWENLLYYGRLKGQSGEGLYQQAEALLRDLGLWDRRFETVGAFSRGTQQKVAIACALVANPPILLLDEPTLGLDVHAARMVKSWIERLARDHGKTIVLTTHQLDIAEQLCDRVVIMHKGKLVADKLIGDLLSMNDIPEMYEIKVAGQLDQNQQRLFSDVSLIAQKSATVLFGELASAKDFYKLLDRVRDAELLLLSATKLQQQSLEEVFVHLMKKH